MYARNKQRNPRAEATDASECDTCRRCGSEIQRADRANRTVYWCPVCQPV